MAILQLFFTKGHAPGGVEDLGGNGLRGPRLIMPSLRFHDNFRTAPPFRISMCDDLRSGFAERLIGSRVIQMPVRVKQRANAVLLELFSDDLEEIRRAIRQSAIDQH